MTKHLIRATLAALVVVPIAVHAGDTQRQAEVARLGADVMPFTLSATTHIFTKTADSGTERIVAKDARDAQQVASVRGHLHNIQAEISQRRLLGTFARPGRGYARRGPT